MAALKCNSCARWSFERGGEIEQESYYKYRDCIMDRKDLRKPKSETKGGDQTESALSDVQRHED